MRIKIITINMRCKENNWVIRDDDQNEIETFCREHCVIRTYITPTEKNSMFLLTLEYNDNDPIVNISEPIKLNELSIPENNSTKRDYCLSKY